MKTLEEIRQWLTQHKPILQERYQISEIGIFGSYVRQEQTEASDVDVLVEFSQIPSLLKFINLENYLSDNLGVKVDLVLYETNILIFPGVILPQCAVNSSMIISTRM